MNDVDAINTIVGRNLVAQRKARGLTLDQLAQASGVSRGMVVQIEQGKTNPSVATLCRLANALVVPISKLIETDLRPAAYKTKLSDASELWRGAAGGLGRLITGFDEPSVLEFWEWRLSPRESYDGIAHPPGTKELLFVTAGTLTVTAGPVCETVATQEALVFSADVPHRYANELDHEVVFMMVVVEPRTVARAGAGTFS
ncbi:XRE family transcriptional regulator [Burkholderia sp. Bp9012]|uniref:helix-turn-helix domain-containing protein n=1 Tax=Burkholderia sp. Bp9012 TaxID=2184562 RepID=UPI000F5AE5FF|nr:XRE family transcriptional regulator [Burkholderia sp. Bp9012]RQR85274.1 XRE family transcriptional regulator [Burkholderia sp. Bp9012]